MQEDFKNKLLEAIKQDEQQEDKNIYLYVINDIINELDDNGLNTKENINNLFKLYESENINGSINYSTYKDLLFIKNHLLSIVEHYSNDTEATEILKECYNRRPGVETIAVYTILNVLETILFNLGLEPEEEENEETQEIKQNIFKLLYNDYLKYYRY